MYTVKTYYECESIEAKEFAKKKEAVEYYRTQLAEYLVGYGVTWNDIEEDKHREQLLAMNLSELEDLAAEAYENDELDYAVVVEKCTNS